MKHEENIIQEEMLRRRMQEELKIQEMKFQMKSKEHERRDKIVNEERVNVKLPKFVIRKFDGTSLDWFRFWNQFESEIGKADIGPVGKFSYQPNLYCLVSLVSQLKLLIPIFNVLPRYLLFKIHIQTEHKTSMKS